MTEPLTLTFPIAQEKVREAITKLNTLEAEARKTLIYAKQLKSTIQAMCMHKFASNVCQHCDEPASSDYER